MDMTIYRSAGNAIKDIVKIVNIKMPSLDFEVWCAVCGEGICDNYTIKGNKYGFHFQADPCEKCIDHAHDEGLQDRQLEINSLEKRIEQLEGDIVKLLTERSGQ